jgi:hypothetical protein
MVQFNVDPCSPLKDLLLTADPSLNIYTNGGVPSADLPEYFIAIDANGGIGTSASKFGNAKCVLAMSLYTSLLSTGKTNINRENWVLGNLQPALQEATRVTSGGYSFTYEVSRFPFIYSGKSLISGYSTKTININCYINY